MEFLKVSGEDTFWGRTDRCTGGSPPLRSPAAHVPQHQLLQVLGGSGGAGSRARAPRW